MPAIPSTGAVSLTDLSTEFGGTAPHSMSEYYRSGGNVPDNNTNVPASGRIRFSDWRGAINQIALNAVNATNLDVSTLFGSDWTSTVPKKLTVGSGVTIGGTGSSAALIIPSNMAGTLEIYNVGNIIGFGGSANGGSGGDAISNAATGVTVTNLGLLAGGGGGGGLGGVGGGGSYTTTSTTGPLHSANIDSNSYTYSWHYQERQSKLFVIWAGTQVYSGSWSTTPKTVGGYTYTKGNLGASNFDGEGYSWHESYFVSRSSSSTTNTNGGSGGAGGVGQGYNQSNTSGSSGASGGTNAGTGGTGGTGAAYGTAGSTGSTGANGNSSNGSAGASGGAAGAAVAGTTVTMNNSGTLAGAVA